MKKIFAIAASALASLQLLKADDKPVTFDKLPKAAKEFINANYPGEKVTFAAVDDDLVRPDYSVLLGNGVKLQFEHSGALEKIECAAGIPEGLVPYQIKDYEIGKKNYEVKLSNRLDLKFNKNFHLIEIDD